MMDFNYIFIIIFFFISWNTFIFIYIFFIILRNILPWGNISCIFLVLNFGGIIIIIPGVCVHHNSFFFLVFGIFSWFICIIISIFSICISSCCIIISSRSNWCYIFYISLIIIISSTKFIFFLIFFFINLVIFFVIHFLIYWLIFTFLSKSVISFSIKFIISIIFISNTMISICLRTRRPEFIYNFNNRSFFINFFQRNFNYSWLIKLRIYFIRI